MIDESQNSDFFFKLNDHEQLGINLTINTKSTPQDEYIYHKSKMFTNNENWVPRNPRQVNVTDCTTAFSNNTGIGRIN